jgi:hypothetical protein
LKSEILILRPIPFDYTQGKLNTLRAGYAQDRFRVWHLFAGGEKVAPGRKASKHTQGVNSGSKKTLPL